MWWTGIRVRIAKSDANLGVIADVGEPAVRELILMLNMVQMGMDR